MAAAPAETIVITGASSGIGRELAIQSAEPGKEIWLVGRNEARLAEVAGIVAERGAVPMVLRLDLSDTSAASEALQRHFPAEKRIDTVYLSAAVTLFGEVRDMLAEDWDLMYRTTLLSPVQWVHHFYSNMVARKNGRIVLVSSLAAYAGYPTATAYATMKAGMLGLYRSLVHEGKAHNVAIHIVSPGYVDTNIYKSAVFRKTSFERTMKQIESLGFPVLSAARTAEVILRSVRRGKAEFALPGYASLMTWLAPRAPILIDMVHARIIKRFRQNS